MATLVFDCVGARAQSAAVTPTLGFTVRIAETTGVRVHAIALRCQIRIEPIRRQYTPAEQERLGDLFGEVARWGDTLKPMQFATVSVMVPGFTGSCEVDLPVPCTYDLEVASARYFNALDDGTVPLVMLYSGSIFLATEQGFSVQPVPWSAESAFRLPVAVWREMVDRDFPGAGWIRCSRETIDALGRYKYDNALPTWDATIAALLDEAVARDV